MGLRASGMVVVVFQERQEKTQLAEFHTAPGLLLGMGLGCEHKSAKALPCG